MKKFVACAKENSIWVYVGAAVAKVCMTVRQI